MKSYFLSSLAIILLSCNEEKMEPLSDFEINKNKWEALAIDSYSCTFKISCFCIREATLPKRIQVVNGRIVNVNAAVSAEIYTINVTASNASDYTLSGADRNGNVTGNDPSVTIKVGDTIDFAVDASGHPFYLKTVQGTGTSDLISGVTNNGATNGTVSWTPTAAGTYYYQCSLHNGMYGTITVN